jgi:hypothetical protein
MPHPVADILLKAATHNGSESHRQGNLLEFRSGERLIVCGDLHGHRHNLAKVIAYAALGSLASRMLIIQEVIHGGAIDNEGGDRSFELLVRAARLKNQFPSQVHFLLSNHDMAQFTDNEITKNGCGFCKAFDIGLAKAYGADAEEIGAACDVFFRSQPLAGRCPNGIFISHTLPSPARCKHFDPEIFHRPYREQDFRSGGAVYDMVWGRHHDEATLDQMALLLNCTMFVNAHQNQDDGFALNGRQLIIASDHAHGTIAEFSADENIPLDLLSSVVRPIVRL